MFLISRIWRSYGVEIVISTTDITTAVGCDQLIREAISLGPVGGLFNLAVALRDGIFENQDVKMFNESLGPKADATKYLDEISQQLCPELKHFVVFSSVSCGRGNAGQSNYGMANSIMERIMLKRAKLGLPAKAIQWGAVGDVGLLAALQEKNMEMTIGGTLPQSITNCIEVLDILLSIDETVVSSMIVAEKKFDDVKKGNIIDTIFNIMSIRDKKSISMDTTLSRLGMDSLMGVEIQQVLERDYDIALSPQEMRTLTLSQLEKRVHSKESHTSKDKNVLDGIALLLTSFGDEATSDQTILKLQSKVDDGKTKLLIIPGLEAMAGEIWHEVARDLNYPTYILQLGNAAEADNIDEVLNFVSKVNPMIFEIKLRNLNFLSVPGRSRTLFRLAKLHSSWIFLRDIADVKTCQLPRKPWQNWFCDSR
jgi:fatty acid synthase, animal type